MKNKKLIITISCIAFSIIVGCVIWYCINPEQCFNFFRFVWNQLNDPLPLVGVSIITIGAFIFSFLKQTTIGKKGIVEIKQTYDSIIEEKNKAIASLEETKNLLESKTNEINELKDTINKIIDILPNKRLKELINNEKNNENEN